MDPVSLLAGALAAAATVVAARSAGFDRDPSFYPVALIVIALLVALNGAAAGEGEGSSIGVSDVLSLPEQTFR